MRSIITLAGTICLSLLMSACATKQRPYNLLDADARPHIQKMDRVLFAKHDEIRSNIKPSKLSLYLQGHFAPILFDLALNGVRHHQANQIMKPIHAKLEDYDYAYDVKEQFTHAINQTNMADEGKLKLVRNEQPGFRAAYIQESDADAVMFIDVNFAFTPKFDVLYLSSHAMVFPNNEALSAYKETPDEDGILEFEDNIYRNQFLATIPVETPEGSSKSENGAAWAAMSEDELKGLMQLAALKLADHLGNDLQKDDFFKSAPDTGGDTDVVPETQTTTETDTETAPEDKIEKTAQAASQPVSDEEKEPTIN